MDRLTWGVREAMGFGMSLPNHREGKSVPARPFLPGIRNSPTGALRHRKLKVCGQGRLCRGATRALGSERMSRHARVAKSPAERRRSGRWELVGDSTPMARLRSRIAAVARRGCTVLIHGESGSGKEVAARHIHQRSARAAGAFIPVDCATLQPALAESQLFGHREGSFTGAAESTRGVFRAADGGTLMLDEIGELRPDVQAKLLRCLQDGAVVPLGGIQPIPVNVRVLAASHRDLAEMARRGQFREDLLYRLNVVQLRIPPLRDRLEDVPALIEHFLSLLADLYDEPRRTIAPAAMAALTGYAWPGNVRQLRNAIEHAHVFAESRRIALADLPPAVQEARRTAMPPAAADRDEPTIVPLAEAERDLIARALCATKGNQSHAARLLQVHRQRLRRKIRRYGLEHLL